MHIPHEKSVSKTEIMKGENEAWSQTEKPQKASLFPSASSNGKIKKGCVSIFNTIL